jgi:peptidoglycan glycosyltransferase
VSSNILRVGTLFFLGFVLVGLALGYWQVVAAPELTGSRHNPRLVEEAARIERGRILDRGGRVLVESVVSDGRARRVHHLPAAAHATGYFSARLGASGVEAAFNDYLSGERSPDLLERVRGRLLHTRQRGSDVMLTLDARIQAAAARALGNARGAVVALDPRTGAVLALYSAPVYDPATLDRDWEALRASEGDPLFNRAIQARYTPGSTFKIVTATAAVDLGLVDLGQPITCTKPVRVDRLMLDCRNNAHLPRLTYKEAFAWSSNRTFGLTGLLLATPPPLNLWLSDEPPGPYPWKDGDVSGSAARLEEYAARFLFDRPVPFDLPVEESHLKTQTQWTADLLGQTAFGQGQLAETPLVAALGAAAIANQGRVPAPYIVAEAVAPDGVAHRMHEPGGWLEQAMQPATAATLNEFMVEGVARGYAAKAALPGVQVGGKTGTAEVGERQTPHAWFVGYAPADQPLVAVAVIMEHAGSGADVATPAARQVLAEALQVYRR